MIKYFSKMNSKLVANYIINKTISELMTANETAPAAISLTNFILESYFGLITLHIFSATVFKASTLKIKPIKII